MNKSNWWWFTFALGIIMIFTGLINTDYANHKFWWTLWDITTVSGVILCIGSWIIGDRATKENK